MQVDWQGLDRVVQVPGRVVEFIIWNLHQSPENAGGLAGSR